MQDDFDQKYIVHKIAVNAVMYIEWYHDLYEVW